MTTRDEHHIISRIADREADLADWEVLDGLARGDARVWERLALTLRDETALRLAVEAQLVQAERVAVQPRGVRVGLGRWQAWSGWAAALLVAGLWWGLGAADRAAPGDRPAPVVPDLLMVQDDPMDDPMDAADVHQPLRDPRYVDSDIGTGPRLHVADVLHEFPKLLLETRRADDGEGLEVLYLRRSLERQVVTGAFRLGRDELGHPQPVPVDIDTLAVSEVL